MPLRGYMVKKSNPVSKVNPKVNVTTFVEGKQADDFTMLFIPEHLERIAYEMIQNALRATVENCPPDSLPPVEVLISKGASNVCIKVSDLGGGASLEKQSK